MNYNEALEFIHSRMKFGSQPGMERIEALCDAFCKDLSMEYGALTPRFSPGYGDLPLDIQRSVFRFLEPEIKIGLTLSESLIMCPSKSVTAFVGILD